MRLQINVEAITSICFLIVIYALGGTGITAMSFCLLVMGGCRVASSEIAAIETDSAGMMLALSDGAAASAISATSVTTAMSTSATIITSSSPVSVFVLVSTHAPLSMPDAHLFPSIGNL